jgi:heptosyltransferase III
MRNAEIDWNRVRRVLVVRLRSIGDTVLATPSLIALKRFVPDAQVDILLEDWVAPVLEGFDAVDNVLTVSDSHASRMATARKVRAGKYDVTFNLHGGTTATFLTFASGARHRVGYKEYQYSFLHNHRLSSSADFWGRGDTHSAEHQLGLLGYVGIPVSDRPRSRLAVTDSATRSLDLKCRAAGISLQSVGSFALLHPIAAFKTKEWPLGNFARVAEFLKEKGVSTIAVAADDQRDVLSNLQSSAGVPIYPMSDLTLPELTALASKARLFVGNDSGVAHIAAAVSTPSVVVFGSSNRNHWGPWTDAPYEMVFEQFPCQPCPGRECKEFGEPRCIQNVTVDSVSAAIDRMLAKEKADPKAR